jgi:hypothetical protein
MTGGDVLLLEWSAPPEADPSDRWGWLWASPDWSPERERTLIAESPLPGFATEYLVQHDDPTGVVDAGELLVAEDVWLAARSAGLRPDPGSVLAAAVEDDFGRGGAVALAWRAEGRICVRAWPLPLRDCWLQVRSMPRVVCGLSLRDSEGAMSVGAVGVGAREASAGLSVWRELLESDGLRWDGTDRLAREGAAMRVTRSSGNQLLLRPGQDATVWRAALFAVMEAAAVPVGGFWVG